MNLNAKEEIRYYYMDESGEPGVAKSDRDYLLVCVVMFPNLSAAMACADTIDRFKKRANLDPTYELHHSRNSKTVRKAFLELIPNLEFSYAVVAIRKTPRKNHANYQRIAKTLLSELPEDKHAKLYMDINPTLRKELKQELKMRPRAIDVKETESRGNNLIQLADYVVAATAKTLKQARPRKIYHQFEHKCASRQVLEK